MARFFLRACFLHNYWDTTSDGMQGTRNVNSSLKANMRRRLGLTYRGGASAYPFILPSILFIWLFVTTLHHRHPLLRLQRLRPAHPARVGRAEELPPDWR